jgi:hypothetical protein
VSAWGEIVGRAVLAWMNNRPFSEEARAARKAKRAARRAKRQRQPDEAAEDFHSQLEDRPMAIDLGTRTTTNMTVSGLVVFGIMKLLSTFFPGFPTEGLEEAIAAVVAYVVGYFSKSPANPKVL